jgi:hypothetical protein
MTIGLPIVRDRAELRLDRLLTQPFRGDATDLPRRRSSESSSRDTPAG